MTKIELGVNNCFAVKRWPQPFEWAEFVATSLEVKNVQFSFDLLDPRSTEPALTEISLETVDACKRHGITIDTTFTGLMIYSLNLLTHPYLSMRIDALDWYTRAIRLTSMLRARGTGGHVAAFSVRDHGDIKKRKELESFLSSSVEHLTLIAAQAGQKLFLIEPMPVAREIMPCTISETQHLLKSFNDVAHLPVKLNIDVGHSCGSETESSCDTNPYSWVEQLGQESPVIHIQQTDGSHDCHWPFTEKYNKIGLIKPDKLIQAIDKSGAEEVILVLEAIHPFETRDSQVLEDIKASIKYWKQYI